VEWPLAPLSAIPWVRVEVSHDLVLQGMQSSKCSEFSKHAVDVGSTEQGLDSTSETTLKEQKRFIQEK